MSTPEQNIRSLEKQLVSYTMQKMTPASKRSRQPALEIRAMASTYDDKGKRKVIIFKLVTVQMSYEQGQTLTYKASCPLCKKRKITAETTYLKRDALWPPEDGYPDRCETCEAKAAA